MKSRKRKPFAVRYKKNYLLHLRFYDWQTIYDRVSLLIFTFYTSQLQILNLAMNQEKEKTKQKLKHRPTVVIAGKICVYA